MSPVTKQTENFLTRLNNKSLEDPKKFVLEQLYPAILGSFIYLIAEGLFGQINLWIGIFKGKQSLSFSGFITLKYILVITIISFYYADFEYIKNTKIYRWWYLLFDLIFMVTLLYSIKLIDISSTKEIDTLGIATCFLVFIILYLVWDFYEFKNSKNKEREFYKDVMIWEACFLIYLVIILFVCTPHPLYPIKSIYPLFGLPIFTIWFWKLAETKKQFNPTDKDKLHV